MAEDCSVHKKKLEKEEKKIVPKPTASLTVSESFLYEDNLFVILNKLFRE